MIIDISHNIDEVAKWLDDIAKKQLPFAIAKALTQTAKDVRDEVVRTLPEKFTLRTKWYESGPYAFKIVPATKTKLEAAVYTKAPFMQLQEEGGVKVAHGGKKYLAIPTTAVRPNKSKLIPANLKPAFLLRGQTSRPGSGRRIRWRGMSAAQSAFIGTINGRLGIWQRQGAHLKLMYNLKEAATIHPRLYFEQTAKRVVDKKFNENFSKALDEAIRTAK